MLTSVPFGYIVRYLLVYYFGINIPVNPFEAGTWMFHLAIFVAVSLSVGVFAISASQVNREHQDMILKIIEEERTCCTP